MVEWLGLTLSPAMSGLIPNRELRFQSHTRLKKRKKQTQSEKESHKVGEVHLPKELISRIQTVYKVITVVSVSQIS